MTIPSPPLPAEHGTKRQSTARRLLEAVFEGRFEPRARLRVEHLAAELGVSVTPIREALVELAGIGIVELQPNRGAVLRPFGTRQLREICHLRRILESEAARCCCGRIAPAELRDLAERMRRLMPAPRTAEWLAEARRLDSLLHETVAGRCGNERLADEIGRYRVLFGTLRDVWHARRQDASGLRWKEENAEHLAVVEAILADRPEESAAAMASHIDRASEDFERLLFDPTSPPSNVAAPPPGESAP